MRPEKLYVLTILPKNVEVSRHSTAAAARAAGRDYCDTDLFSGEVKQYIRIDGPDTFQEHWHKTAQSTYDGRGLGKKYVQGVPACPA